MKFKIDFKWPNGHEDSLIITGETFEEIQTKASSELAKRDATGIGSEWLDKIYFQD